jgi:hypothetical protein
VDHQVEMVGHQPFGGMPPVSVRCSVGFHPRIIPCEVAQVKAQDKIVSDRGRDDG